MKLENKHSIFNMGDTSIRVKQLVEVNRFILKHINEYMKDEIQWERNTALQEDFYKSFIEQIAKTKKFCTFPETVDKPLIQLSLRSNVDYLKNVLYFIM